MSVSRGYFCNSHRSSNLSLFALKSKYKLCTSVVENMASTKILNLNTRGWDIRHQITHISLQFYRKDVALSHFEIIAFTWHHPSFSSPDHNVFWQVWIKSSCLKSRDTFVWQRNDIVMLTLFSSIWNILKICFLWAISCANWASLQVTSHVLEFPNQATLV